MPCGLNPSGMRNGKVRSHMKPIILLYHLPEGERLAKIKNKRMIGFIYDLTFPFLIPDGLRPQGIILFSL